jgi:hypothetical protein
MARIDVDTNELTAGGGHQAAVAATIGGSAGLVRAAGAAIAGAAGSAGAAAAGSDWGAAWEAELTARADTVGWSARSLEAAAAAYQETDAGQIRT